MQDIALDLPLRPGGLALFGRVLGAAGVSLEGGGVFTVGDVARAHFLVASGARARAALEQAGLSPVHVSEVVLLRLDQGTPGQLGEVAQRMADSHVDIQVQYSDHDHQLVLVVNEEHRPAALRVAEEWAARRSEPREQRAAAPGARPPGGSPDPPRRDRRPTDRGL